MPRILHGRDGVVMPLVLCFILVFSIELIGLMGYSAGSLRQVKSQESYVRNFYAAEAAEEKALANIKYYLNVMGVAPDASAFTGMESNPPSLTGTGFTLLNYSVEAQNGGVWTPQVLSTGDYAGLNANVQKVDLTMTAQGYGKTISMTQTIEIQQIPVFQFGVFYQEDLEIHPGANMTFSGPVHTNGNMYLSAYNGTNSTFSSSMTAVGDIFHARKESGSTLGTGNVYIKDGSGVSQSMYQNGTWLDSTQSNWALDAEDRWDGNVHSADHNVNTLSLPIPAVAQTHDIIERAVVGDSAQLSAQKMNNKAHLRIFNNGGSETITDSSGNAVELRYCTKTGFANVAYGGGCPSGYTAQNPLSNTTFYDYREGHSMFSTDVDVAKLMESPNFAALVNANPSGIVVYASSNNQNTGAYRLVNGSTLPAYGMTFATENPLYIKGSYNSVSKKAAGLVSDALTLLSSSWSDSYNGGTSLNTRTVAADMTVNAAVITGNKDTSGSTYSGGFENIHRFLEKWTGRTLNFSGSVAVMYNSEHGTGNWQSTGIYYNAPSRNWGFDTAFTNPSYSIPGFPSVFNVVRTEWKTS